MPRPDKGGDAGGVASRKFRVMTPHKALLAAHDYALVDRPRVSQMPFPWTKEKLPAQPLVPDMYRSDAGSMPGLLPLKPDDAPWIGDLCANLEIAGRNPQERVLSCLLAVDEGVSQDALARHLTKRLTLYSPQRITLLRYYDASVFLHLDRILWPEQLFALYGPIKTWTCPFNDGWTSLARPAPEGVIPLLPSVKAGQRTQIGFINAINGALGQWRYKLKQPWRDLEEFRRAADQAERAMVIAQNDYGLRTKNELTAFALHSLSYGEHFYRHARIQLLFEKRAQSQNPNWRYNIDALVITPDEWATIAAETQTQNFPE